MRRTGSWPSRERARSVGRGARSSVARASWRCCGRRGRACVEGSRCELVTIVGRARGREVAAGGGARRRSRGPGRARSLSLLRRGDHVLARSRASGRIRRAAGGASLARPIPGAAAAVASRCWARASAGTSADEIAWAFRQAAGAAEAPLVVRRRRHPVGRAECLLDLLEPVGLFSAGAPLLLLCLARPELGERRPRVAGRAEAGAAGRGATSRRCFRASVPDGLRGRIARAAGGNPLFVEEMVAVAAGAGDEVVVPPTLKALLAARLDQLERARSVGARACGGRGRGLPSWRRAGARRERGAGDAAARGAAAQGADSARPVDASPATTAFASAILLIRDAAYDATAEGDSGGAARALRRLARAERRRPGRARRDPRLPPRAGLPLPHRAGPARR